jgi:hypothetical protein
MSLSISVLFEAPISGGKASRVPAVWEPPLSQKIISIYSVGNTSLPHLCKIWMHLFSILPIAPLVILARCPSYTAGMLEKRRYLSHIVFRAFLEHPIDAILSFPYVGGITLSLVNGRSLEPLRDMSFPARAQRTA